MREDAVSGEFDPEYRGLYRIGGLAAWIVAFLTIAEIMAFIFFPQPSSIRGWFILFQTNPILGVLDFWGLEVLMYAMFVLVFLALYVVLRVVNKSAMAIALIVSLLGIAVFFATSNPFSLVPLSRQFATATNEVSRSTLLAAGEAILANTNQRAIGGFNTGLFLVSIAGLIFSAVMFRSTSFSRWTAYTGVVAFGLSLADYVRQAFTSSVIIALLLILPGALLLVIWFVLVGRSLWQKGKLRE